MNTFLDRTYRGLRFFTDRILAYWGYPAVERMYMMGRTTQSMILVLWLFQACLLVSFTLMALVAAFHC